MILGGKTNFSASLFPENTENCNYVIIIYVYTVEPRLSTNIEPEKYFRTYIRGSYLAEPRLVTLVRNPIYTVHTVLYCVLHPTLTLIICAPSLSKPYDNPIITR